MANRAQSSSPSPPATSVDLSASHISQATSDWSESFGHLSEDISSEDEIVWSFSELSSGAASPLSQRAQSPGTFSDDDLIVVSRPRSPPQRFQSFPADPSAITVDALSRNLARLDIQSGRLHDPERTPIVRRSGDKLIAKAPSAPSTPKRRSRKRRSSSAAVAEPLSPTTPKAKQQPITPPATPPASASKKKKHASAKFAVSVKEPTTPPKSPKSTKAKSKSAAPQPPAVGQEASGLGERPIVDDVSEAGDFAAGRLSKYDEAVQYVTSALADPETKPHSNLNFLQALIIELGLETASEALPRSLRAARAILKAQVFLNVKDYLAVRHKGLDAVRSVMHPSRKALVDDIKTNKKTRKVPVDVVKKTGLNVFLVTCYR